MAMIKAAKKEIVTAKASKRETSVLRDEAAKKAGHASEAAVREAAAKKAEKKADK